MSKEYKPLDCLVNGMRKKDGKAKYPWIPYELLMDFINFGSLTKIAAVEMYIVFQIQHHVEYWEHPKNIAKKFGLDISTTYKLIRESKLIERKEDGKQIYRLKNSGELAHNLVTVSPQHRGELAHESWRVSPQPELEKTSQTLVKEELTEEPSEPSKEVMRVKKLVNIEGIANIEKLSPELTKNEEQEVLDPSSISLPSLPITKNAKPSSEDVVHNLARINEGGEFEWLDGCYPTASFINAERSEARTPPPNGAAPLPKNKAKELDRMPLYRVENRRKVWYGSSIMRYVVGHSKIDIKVDIDKEGQILFMNLNNRMKNNLPPEDVLKQCLKSYANNHNGNKNYLYGNSVAEHIYNAFCSKRSLKALDFDGLFGSTDSLKKGAWLKQKVAFVDNRVDKEYSGVQGG